MERWKASPCIFRRLSRCKENIKLVEGIYVEDLTVTGGPRLCKSLREDLSMSIPIKNLGGLCYYMQSDYTGEREKRTLFVSQAA